MGNQTQPSAAKLDCLDGLRGVAILLVVLYHLAGGGGQPYHRLVAGCLEPFRYGFTGVHLFLVLSGFCLTHSLIRRAAVGRAPTLRSYLASRFWRIAPPYYMAMAVYLAFPVVYLIVGHPSELTGLLTVRQVGSHLLFAHGYWPDTIDAICTVFWSLSLEFQFYLALPLLFLLGKRSGASAVILGVAALSLGWRLLLPRWGTEYGYLVNGCFLGRWTEFALGMGVAFWFNSPARQRTGINGHRRWWFLALALALFGLGVGFDTQRSGLADFAFGGGYAALLAAALQSSELDHRGGLGRALSWAPLVWVGMVSYSLYLIHPLALERGLQLYHRFVKNPGLVADATAVVVLFLASLTAGWIFYRLVERHFVRSVDASKSRTGQETARAEAAPMPVAVVAPPVVP
ncbi:MAG: acyltransferase [Isosphaeraceae bacterium]